jgi:glycosyltransferase involved in cell wall biosynthesis
MEALMRIGIDGRELVKDRITGIGRFLLNFLGSDLSIKEDWQFVIFLNQYSKFDKDEPHFKKIVIPEKITFWWDQIQLSQWLARENIDLFFSPYYKVPLLTRSKTVITLFDITYLMISPYKDKLSNRLYIRNFLKHAVRKADKIITSSNYSLREISSKLNIPEEKISIVPIGVGDNFKPVRDRTVLKQIKEKHGIKNKYILYIGNFSPHKNLKKLIDAYNLLPDRIKKEYHLVLGGGKAEELKTAYDHSDISKLQSITILGQPSDEDLPALYSGAQLFIFPSLYEGFGLPPLEAMACGCAVASSNTSSMPEVLGDASLFFNPSDAQEISRAIEQMLEDEKLRNEFRQKGLARAEHFSSRTMITRLLDVFESVIRGRT